MSNRGNQTHNSLFPLDPVTVEAPAEAEVRQMRREHLMRRYVWYSEDGRLRSDYIFARLRVEFYLEEITIRELIQDNAGRVKQMRNEGLGVAELKRLYPFFDWRNKDF